jgi:hypothetical protein
VIVNGRAEGFALTHAGQRLTFTPVADGSLCFIAEVAEGEGWRRSANLPTPLVGGLDLALIAWQAADGGVRLTGANWSGQVETVGDLFRFTVTVELAADLAVTPELVLWLGLFNVMDDRQGLIWRRTLVPGPTANGQGMAGNDLPAAYLYDPVRKVETVLAVDAAHMAWAPGRLLGYRCQERYDAAQGRYGIGLVRTAEPMQLPTGTHSFIWYLWQGAANHQPTAWSGAATLVQRLAPVLQDPSAVYSGGAWARLAAGCLADLQHDACWVAPEGVEGLRAYVRDSSKYFGEENRHFFELMTQMDVLPPLALYNRLHPSTVGQETIDKLLRTLPHFHRPDIHCLVNTYPNGGTFADLWYPFENSLIKLGWLVAINGDESLKAIWADVLQGASTMATKLGHVFPLFAEMATNEPAGACPNFSVAGMYAFAQVLAHELLGDPKHLAEARFALDAMRRLPLDVQYHEPQQLAFAAAAAAILGEIQLASDFLHAQLRQAYWFGDPGADGADVRGMFQACASLLYPAFKENVEAILPWTILLKHGVGDAGLLLKFIALQRQNNLAYFDEAICPAIPYENLGTSELPARGVIGKQIYGAGEVFWLYLLTEAFSQVDDPAILTVYLDLLTPQALAGSAKGGDFLLYNPTGTTRSFRFGGVPYTLSPGAFIRHNQ